MTQENFKFFVELVLGFSGLYLIMIGAIMKTGNIRSGLLFRVLPIVLGILVWFILLNQLGFVFLAK